MKQKIFTILALLLMAATGTWARTMTNNVTLPQTLCCADMQEISSACPSGSDEDDNTTYTDPEGRDIWDQGLIDWLKDNGFTQADINNLGSDAAATDKLYLYWLLNCDFRQPNMSASLNVTGIQVNNNSVSITVQLVRKAPLGFINGVLHIYGMTNLANGEWSMISEESVGFGDGDSIFDTEKTTELVTQSVTATFDASWITGKFFKAVIEFPTPEEPWEEEPEEPEEPEE